MKYLSIVLLFVALLTACEKDQTKVDEKIILDYLEEHGLTAEKHASGLYYQTVREGNGIRPDQMSTIQVQYTGYLTDGVVFDEARGEDTLEIQLYNLIQGWQIGLPLMKNGGNTIFYFPSEMGYGENATGVIPENSVLIFDIELLDSWH
jgi:FKBP-type peptidyl-prolyl cis-trans isomerase